MENTYVKCADWSWEDKLLYIKACIGEDIPHDKICGHSCHSRGDLLEMYKNSADYMYCYSIGMICFDVKSNGLNLSGGYREVELSDLKPTPTKFVKVEESIFDLKKEFERGELYEKGSDYTKLISESDFAFAYRENAVYRKVEIDWRDEVKEVYDAVELPVGEQGSLYMGEDWDEQEFIKFCHLVASLTEKPEGV